MNLKDYFLIIRPTNCFIAAIGAFIGYSLAIGSIQFSNLLVMYAMLAVFFVCAGGQTINDYFDFAIDRKAKKERALVKGNISRMNALYYSFILFLTGIIISYFIHFTAFIVAIIFSLLLIFYSGFLGKYKFIGNWIVAFSVAFTIIYGALIEMWFCLPLVLFFSALLSNAGREITKDMEDLETEKGVKITLPQKISFPVLNHFILILYLGAIIIGFIPLYWNRLNNVFYLFFMVLAVISLMYSVKLLQGRNFRKSQAYSKIGMGLGLIAFLLGLL
ncbi:MAG: UbiA family prenyltransferase [archaeon]